MGTPFSLEFTHAKLPQVLGPLGHQIGKELHLHAAQLLPANCDIEEARVVGVRSSTTMATTSHHSMFLW